VRVFLLIAFGALGTLARYALQGWMQQRTGPGFPSGTLAVNLSGCLLLGFLAQLTLNRMVVPPEWRIAITIGFFGAFTTFSSFGWETIKMLEDGEWVKACLYAGTSVFVGLWLVQFGIRLANRL
jgi:CrcB protein